MVTSPIVGFDFNEIGHVVDQPWVRFDTSRFCQQVILAFGEYDRLIFDTECERLC